MTARSTRVLRGSTAAVIATYLAALSHTFGGGATPSPVAAALALAVAVPLCVALAGRRLSFPSAGAAVALSQLAYHGLFSFLGAGGAAALSSAGTVGAATAHHGHGIVDAATLLGSGAAAGHVHGDSAMWLAHLAAGVVTVLVLLRGEAALTALVHAVALRVRQALGVLRWFAPAAPRSVRVAPVAALVARLAEWHLRVLRHRGPPLLLAS